MTNFIATDDTASDEPVLVKNDGWFPDIDLQHLRDAMRLDGTVTDARLTQAVIDAVLYVNRELSDWQAEQQAAGRTDLAAVPAKQINEESVLLAYYRRAVYSRAKADLIERYRDYDTTAEGNKKAEQLAESIDEQRRNAHWAIADIIGRRHLTVELI